MDGREPFLAKSRLLHKGEGGEQGEKGIQPEGQKALQNTTFATSIHSLRFLGVQGKPFSLSLYGF